MHIGDTAVVRRAGDVIPPASGSESASTRSAGGPCASMASIAAPAAWMPGLAWRATIAALCLVGAALAFALSGKAEDKPANVTGWFSRQAKAGILDSNTGSST